MAERAQVRPVALLLALLLALGPLSALADCPVNEQVRALPAAGREELSLATQNLWRLSAAEQTPALLAQRLQRWAEHIETVLGYPHILVLQEVDSGSTLRQLVAQILLADGPRYRYQLIDGEDPSGIDVAVLARAPVRLGEVRALFADRSLQGHGLFSRPPLRVEVQAPISFVLLALHLRSGHDLLHPQRGPWVQAKRRAQADAVRRQVLAELAAGNQLVLAGDLNSAPGDGRYAEPWSILAQAPLLSAWQRLPQAERFSYRYRCQPQAIDHILMSPGVAARLSRVAVSRGHAGRYDVLYGADGAGAVLSDHDALKIYLRLPASAPQRPEAGERQ